MKAASLERRDYIPYPTNRVIGTVADEKRAGNAIDALLRAGFDRKDIDILHGEEDLHRLDPTGAAHGFLAQFHRTLISTLDLEQFKHLAHHVEDVRAGRYVIMVLTRRRALRMVAADILHQHGAEFVGFYGRWAVEELPAAPQASPETIPALFARAWNAHDPDAMASLFEEDAEYVNGSGLCWHNRESIRNGHREGLIRIFNESTLATGETKVKLLAPDVAVVHARMTLSDEAPNAAASGARATIVSFVVHRAGGRWLCASAHNSDVIASANPTIVERASGLGASPPA